jgi:kumamolisin
MTESNSRHELKNSLHALPPGSVALRKTRPHDRLELTLGVIRRKDLPDLSDLDEKKPGERTYMTRADMGKEYGSDPDAVAKIRKFAEAHSLLVTRDEPISARLGLAGLVKDLSKAFGVSLFDYTHPTLGDFHARTGPISVPAELEGAITGVFGFNNHRIMHRIKNRRGTQAPQMTASRAFYPPLLSTLYDFPKVDASKQCIALFEFGGGIQTAGLDDYFKTVGVAKPEISVVTMDGMPNRPGSDDATGEVMLDICVAGAMAGGAKVAVYFSTFDEKGLIDVLSAVIVDKEKNDPATVSISYGWDENQRFNNSILWSAAAIDHANHGFLAAAHLGITVCVSSGDNGSEAQMSDGRAHVNFPASSPYVLAVGGTTLHASHDSIQAEIVWNHDEGSSGGGVSDYIPVPDWQKNVVPRSINPGHFLGRGVPDVAANADPTTGYLVLFNGAIQPVGGTSASAPLWASLITRIAGALGKRVGNFNALLYGSIGNTGALRDITVGNNDANGMLDGQFQAKKGWDACTGWGSPDGEKLLAELS